jgi:hypothetical protein
MFGQLLPRMGKSKQSKFCPYCHSARVHRSRRSTLLEQTLLRVISLYPYRCEDCDLRFFTLGPITRKSRGHAHRTNIETADRRVPA